MGGVITQADTNISFDVPFRRHACDMILLSWPILPRWASGSARYIERALLGWQREGIDSGEAAERYLLCWTNAGPRKRTAKLLGLADAKFTKADSRAIADWYESYGYGPDMIAEAAAYAGEKKSVKYVNGILRAWYTKGYKTVRDVMAESAMGSSNVQAAAPAVKHNILGGGLRRAPRVPGMPKEGKTQ
jgi:DnaD/phage-associated family protein